jgi:hypothetical protein
MLVVLIARYIFVIRFATEILYLSIIISILIYNNINNKNWGVDEINKIKV